jgi:predicted RNA-binding protein with PUA-like domain
MAQWLIKSDPETYAIDDLKRDGRTVWDGVANPTALIHLRKMKKGDRLFIYHSGDDKAVVGIAEAVSEPYPDPQKSDPKLVVVDIRYREHLRKPVPLAVIKKRKDMADFPLVTISRLSVMPVTSVQWETLLDLSR